jgi:hypothetical protein
VNRKYCHYFNNGKRCPFAEIGCKFNHELSNECSHGKDCGFSLCQYRHKAQTTKGEEQTNTIDNKIVTVTENDEKSKNEMEQLDEISADENFTPTFISTSTPKKRKFQCEGCSKKSQCENCYLDDYVDNYMTQNNLTDK